MFENIWPGKNTEVSPEERKEEIKEQIKKLESQVDKLEQGSGIISLTKREEYDEKMDELRNLRNELEELEKIEN